jgi:uncharacterized protein (TIGR00369 family)
MNGETIRALHVTWADPLATLQRAATMSREELLAALLSGELPKPPIAEVIGFDVLEVEPGRAAVLLPTREYHCNPLGVVAGGVAATVMDAAMWIAVQTKVPEDTIVTTTDLNVHLVRQVPPGGGTLRAEARAVHVGWMTGTAEARLVDATGTLYSHATASFVASIPSRGEPRQAAPAEVGERH